MAFLPLRRLESGARQEYERWVGSVAEQLSAPECDRFALCRRILTDIYYPQYRDAMLGHELDELPHATRIALLQMDARNITLEPEYYSDIDAERFARVKPLIWLWEMFDKSVLGENLELGVRFRRTLAQHIFQSCGSNFKCFHFVKLSFGYRLEVGDNVTVHRHVLLDDRGGIKLGHGVSIADFSNLYSHTHDLGDARDIETPATVLGDGVRVAYHATILAGVTMHSNSMLGAMAVATKDIASGEVAVGIPAQAKLKRPALADRAPHPRTADPLAE